MIRGQLGNGKQIRFWVDTWVGDEPLKDKFPTLFMLERNKRSLVFDRVRLQNNVRVFFWEWSRSPVSVEEIEAKNQMERLLQDVRLEDKEDSWFWRVGDDLGFTVASVKKWLRGVDNNNSGRLGFTWSKWVPIKCNIFMWRAFLERLPSKVALMRRGIWIDNQYCAWCESSNETIEHLLTGCAIAAGIWQGISTWCKIPGTFLFHVKDLVEWHEHCDAPGNKKMVFHGIVIIACWRIWKARNETIFSGKEPKVVDMIADIKTLGFLWYKHRFKGGVVDWDRWCSFDLM